MSPQKPKIPFVYVQSRGDRDGRPLYPEPRMAEMGCVACIDAIVHLAVSFRFMKNALQEVRETGDRTGMTHEDFAAARQEMEDLIGLDSFCELEEETVEKRKRGER